MLPLAVDRADPLLKLNVLLLLPLFIATFTESSASTDVDIVAPVFKVKVESPEAVWPKLNVAFRELALLLILLSTKVAPVSVKS